MPRLLLISSGPSPRTCCHDQVNSESLQLEKSFCCCKFCRSSTELGLQCQMSLCACSHRILHEWLDFPVYFRACRTLGVLAISMHLFACGFWRLKTDSDPEALNQFLDDRGLTIQVHHGLILLVVRAIVMLSLCCRIQVKIMCCVCILSALYSVL